MAVVPIPIDQDLNLFAKDAALVAQWHSPKLHPLAKKIAIALAQYCAYHDRKGVITSIYRTNSDIHAAWRAIDMRCRSSWADVEADNETFREDELIREKINKRFPYGPRADGQPGETIVPIDHGTAPHFHIQVNTRKP